MKRILYVVAALCIAVSCDPEDIRTVFTPAEPQTVSLRVNVCAPDVKSSLGDDVENKDSGFELIAVNRRTSQVETAGRFGSRSGGILQLKYGETYDFYVVGNMWYINKTTGDKVGWLSKHSASGSDPSQYPVYRFDGNDIQEGLRSETFAEVSSYGIPYSGSRLNYTVNGSESVTIQSVRLFSKVTLEVDHSGLDGGADAEFFVNDHLQLKQANCKVHPYQTTKAEAPADVIALSDYEPSMANGHCLTFVLYVPENRQGALLSGTDPTQKIEANIPEDKRGLVTYVEFAGVVNKAAGGYGGTYTYRFYLGADNCSDFSVERGCNYMVNLGFKVKSLFEPYWKVVRGTDFSDTRLLSFSADSAGDNLLPDNQMLAVRKNRPGKVYVYFNRSGEAHNNERSRLENYSGSYQPADVSRTALSCSIPDMSAYGLNAVYDSSQGLFTVTVVNPALFVAGKTFDMSVSIYPGGQSRTVKVKTCEDLGVSADFSDYYIGMRRDLTATGFCGENVALRLKTGEPDILRSTNSVGSGGYITSQSIQLSGTTVPVYAYKNGSALIEVSSDDTFNDGSYEYPITVLKPRPYYGDIPDNVPVILPNTGTTSYLKAVVLPIDGTPVDLPAYYLNQGGTRIPINSFDPQVYAQLLDFRLNIQTQWLGKDEGNFKVFIKKLRDSQGNYFGFYDNTVPDGFGMVLYEFLHAVVLKPASAQIFSAEDEKCSVDICTIPPYYLNTFADIYDCNYFNIWDDSWSWTKLSQVSTDQILSKWPKIENTIKFYMGDCDPDNVQITFNGAYSNLVKGSRVRKEGNDIYLDWRFAPGESASDCSAYYGALAPYGPQSAVINFPNKQSGEVYSITSNTFNIKYRNVKLRTYAYFTNSDQAEVLVSSPSVLAWMLMERKKNPNFAVPGAGMPIPLNAFAQNMISFTNVYAYTNGADEDYMPYFMETDYTGNLTWMRSDFTAFYKANKSVWEYPTSHFSNVNWTYLTAQETFQDGILWPFAYRFQQGAQQYSALPPALYSDSTLSSIIPFSLDYENLYYEYGSNSLVRQGFMMLDE